MKKKWGIIDYLVIATIIIILLATSWTEKGRWILSSVLIISLTSTFLTNKNNNRYPPFNNTYYYSLFQFYLK